MASAAPTPTSAPADASTAKAADAIRGDVLAVFVFDVGFHVDLEAALPLVHDATRRSVVRARRPAPAWFDEGVPPLAFVLAAEPVEVGGAASDAAIDVLVHDVGAVVLTFRFALPASIAAWPAFVAALHAAPDLEAAARAQAERVLGEIRVAVEQPRLDPAVEDYVILACTDWTEGADPADLLERHRDEIARAIEAETGPLGGPTIARATAGTIAYAPDDLAIVDWNAAVLFDRDPGDLVALLQHANVELLELRLLERELDRMLDDADHTLARIVRRGWWPGFASGRELARFATLQTDAAVQFEGLDNAIKLLGNQYLARAYRLAAERLDLPAWHASVLRKLEAADGLHSRMSDTVATRRLETLEWVIIILIAVSIVLPFTPFY